MNDKFENFKEFLPDYVRSEEDYSLYKIRHTAEHIFNQAVEELWPGKITRAIGPAIENGFYMDGRFEQVVNEQDFEKIEARMREIVQADLPMRREVVSEEKARGIFKDNPFKQELIGEFVKEGGELTLYWTGEDFVDLCKGPHVDSTREVKVVKLLKVAGAYWRGDEKNEMLTRIYGTAFSSQEELDKYLWQLEEAEKRDHKVLGRKLELFMFHETSPGMPYWLPKGLTLYNKLVEFWRERHSKYGYQEIMSPLINKSDLYVTSGHWEHYKEDMFIADMGENEKYGIKPMNCPNAMVVFGSKIRSYRDLPLRLSDTDRLHRYELSGTLNGLLRIRSFQQDDSHNFITEDMVESEYQHIFELCEEFYGIFGLEYKFRLGTRPESYMGEIVMWDKAEGILKNVLENSGKEYFVLEGDGAFYGPKVDILMYDALGREWQMGTIQLDFQQPARFKLKYADKDGQEKTPVVVHRVIYGSLERFIGIIIEQFAGAFPTWIAPVQVKVIPIGEQNIDYANQLESQLLEKGVRVEVDRDSERMQNKIRQAQEEKIPYMLIVGKKEQTDGTVSLRYRDGEEVKDMKFDLFLEKLLNNIEERNLDIKLT